MASLKYLSSFRCRNQTVTSAKRVELRWVQYLNRSEGILGLNPNPFKFATSVSTEQGRGPTRARSRRTGHLTMLSSRTQQLVPIPVHDGDVSAETRGHGSLQALPLHACMPAASHTQIHAWLLRFLDWSWLQRQRHGAGWLAVAPSLVCWRTHEILAGLAT